ncbi:MAG TPA: hypothetical protein VEB21_12895 [Terriglobales bacterium]|nr:hypothetical protein [Terriglobales bacterium]
MNELHPVFAEHLAECDECRGQRAALERISASLRASEVGVDCDRLTAGTLLCLAPAIETNAAEAFWRRVVTALVVAIIPLPLVLAWDAYLMRELHSFLQAFLPSPVATYVTFSYAALLTLLLAGTYAAIPLSAGRLHKNLGV